MHNQEPDPYRRVEERYVHVPVVHVCQEPTESHNRRGIIQNKDSEGWRFFPLNLGDLATCPIVVVCHYGHELLWVKGESVSRCYAYGQKADEGE